LVGFIYGVSYNPESILLSFILCCLILLSIKTLAGKKNWKIGKLKWFVIVFLTLITVNMLPI